MAWVVRYGILALILGCVVSLFGMVVPDPKASNRRFHLYVGSVVAVCAVVFILFQAVVPTDFKVVGEEDEVTETHSLATLKIGSRLSGKATFSFGYLTEKDVYGYPADTAVVYEDADAGEARVERVGCYSTVRCSYSFPMFGDWTRDLCLFDRSETRIHVPKGSILQGDYDFQ